MSITRCPFPGIFFIECIPTKRAFFGQTDGDTFFQLRVFLDNLEQGYCNNKELLTDYKKYGRENFKADVLVVGREYFDSEKRLEAVEKYKSSWDRKLY